MLNRGLLNNRRKPRSFVVARGHLASQNMTSLTRGRLIVVRFQIYPNSSFVIRFSFGGLAVLSSGMCDVVWNDGMSTTLCEVREKA
jgi:hypothetical protein